MTILGEDILHLLNKVSKPSGCPVSWDIGTLLTDSLLRAEMHSIPPAEAA